MLKISALFILIFFLAGSVFAQTTDEAAQAKVFIDALAKKDFAAAYDLFAADVKKQIPAAAMPQIWAQITAEYGEFKRIKEIKKSSDGKMTIVSLEFEKQSENFAMSFDAAGKILGFTVAAPDKFASASAYVAPAYVDTNNFTETETTVGTGEWALPATLTMPKGKSVVPAVVLVHGSGPNDRDETIGGNKVFKDLAWGLASRGVAVLRYEKRTRQYPSKLAAVKNFTVADETVDDAAVAARLLMKTPGVNEKRVFVLGHSLGGYLIPRIGEKEKAIAGFIVFAGATRPLEDVIPEQYAYIFGLDGAITPAEQTQIDEIKKISAKVKALKETDRDSKEFYFGAPVSYYLDLQNYNPPNAAKVLKQPIFVAQGESDYQVTMKDFENWKTALGKRKNVVFKSYPKLTHTFSEGAGGKSSPKDYEKPNHVSETVVADIAEWIKNGAK